LCLFEDFYLIVESVRHVVGWIEPQDTVGA
jgi:hypothetical protein